VLDPLEAFRLFYQDMQGTPMSMEEEKIMMDVINTLQLHMAAE
jgi:exonuclease SbcD